MQGAGNDFVVLDGFHAPFAPDFSFVDTAITLCNRHFGAGSDGLLTLEPSTNGADAQMRMWNPDGTEDMCGNGLRCVAALAARHGHVGTSDFQIQTRAGTRQIEMIRPDFVRAAMGIPLFHPNQIPMKGETERALDYTLRVAGREIPNVSTLSTGSTHTVLFVDEALSETDFQTLSPLIENHDLFPERTSVMWAVSDGANRFRIRIWERGAGETLACGTGACAVAVAAQMTGRASGSIEIESRGGTLFVDWEPGGEISMSGPATYVYEGRVELEL